MACQSKRKTQVPKRASRDTCSRHLLGELPDTGHHTVEAGRKPYPKRHVHAIQEGPVDDRMRIQLVRRRKTYVAQYAQKRPVRTTWYHLPSLAAKHPKDILRNSLRDDERTKHEDSVRTKHLTNRQLVGSNSIRPVSNLIRTRISCRGKLFVCGQVCLTLTSRVDIDMRIRANR